MKRTTAFPTTEAIGFIRRIVILLVAIAAAGFAQPGVAAEGQNAAPNLAGDDAKIRQLFELLDDPAVRQALAQARGGQEHAAAAAPAMTVSLAARLDGLRRHFGELVLSSHEFPAQARMAHTMALEALRTWGIWSALLALAVFVAMGFGAQGLFNLIGGPFRRWLLALRLETVDERVKAVFARLVYGLGLLGSFAVGSVGAFLLFDWPTLLKQMLLSYLIAFVLVRLSTVAGRFLLAPGAERFRVVPMSTELARFLYLRLVIGVALLTFGFATIQTLQLFGLSPLAAEAGEDMLGLLLLILGLETVWRRPPAKRELGEIEHRHHRNGALFLSLAGVALWISWVVQARMVFGIIAFVVALPLAISVGRSAVMHTLRPTGTEADGDERTLQALLFERGVRSFVLIGAALVLAWILGVDLSSLTNDDSLTTRMVRAAVSVAVIGLATEFLWSAIRAVLQRKMNQPLPHAVAGLDAGHAARMQTLLPIISNILLAALVLVAAMMMLAAIGVQIGPLIASAGVVGVAIGFGAQTLVKDVISGIFYLVDDAFRIGEYIQSGSYKGTVESFSLRSVKLRHQRGALYTIPFGSLGAVQNQSRDWVVDKIVLNVPYGTDLEKVRKIIKKIGVQLQEDEVFGADILSPLKMQGVVEFADYAIQIQTKMMTRPGDAQFAGRRRALLLIKAAFEENGIGFAMPTVQVSGDAPQSVAASAFAGVSARKSAALEIEPAS